MSIIDKINAIFKPLIDQAEDGWRVSVSYSGRFTVQKKMLDGLLWSMGQGIGEEEATKVMENLKGQLMLPSEEFIYLVHEVNAWIKDNVANARMYYSGNEDEGRLSYVMEESENKTILPQNINQMILKLSSIACALFIDGKFRRDIKAIENVKHKNPDVNFYVEVGERDSFGPVTYVLIIDNLQIVIC